MTNNKRMSSPNALGIVKPIDETLSEEDQSWLLGENITLLSSNAQEMP